MGGVEIINFILSMCAFLISSFILVIGINSFILPLYITIGTKLWGKLFKWNLYYGEVIAVNNIDVNGKLKPVYTIKYNMNGMDYSIQLNKVGTKKQIGNRVKLIYLQKSNKVKSGEVGYLNWILGSSISLIGIVCLVFSIIWWANAISYLG